MEPEEAPCPVTGRTLWTRPEWNHANDHYLLRIGTMDGRIFVARAYGRVNLDDTNAYCQRIDAILGEFFEPGKPLYVLDEYSHLGKVENLSRDRYVEFYSTKQDRIGALVFAGLHPLIRLYVKLSQRLAAPVYPVTVHDTYADGLRYCQGLLKESAPPPPRPASERTTTRSSVSTDFAGTHYTLHIEMLSSGIVLVQERGKLESHDVAGGVAMIERFLLGQTAPLDGFQLLQDHTGFLGCGSRTAASLRREAIRRLERLFSFRTKVIIDRRTPFLWWRRLLRRTRANVWTALSRDEALEILSKLDGDPSSSALGMGLHQRPGSNDDATARDLLATIANIPWDRQSQFVNPYSMKHPLRAVVDALLVVKSDFDALMRERTLREEELVLARERAEEALRTRSQFLANMSHEIRTPMNGIVGMAELMQGSSLPPEQLQQLSILKRSADSLLGLLNDILDYSRLEARNLEPEAVDFELRPLLEDVRVLFAGTAMRKRVAIVLECPHHLPAMLCGDSGRLRQILTNLVGNAVKFTQTGTITLSASASEFGPDGSLAMTFRVEDTGIGIDPTQVERIFEPFRQVDGSITRRFGGTGLGLSISRQLVEILGGSIKVESMPGRGTTFSFTVPFRLGRNPADTAAQLPVVHPLQGRRILLAEDNEVNRIVAQGLLRKLGVHCIAAEDGAQALAALRVDSFDLVLMDIQMPVMDGLEAIRRIRSGELGPLVAGIPIVALTANALVGDREKCIEAGASTYLAKPIRSSQLRDALSTLL